MHQLGEIKADPLECHALSQNVGHSSLRNALLLNTSRLVGSYDVYGSQESIVFLYFEWSIDNLRNSNLYFLSL